MTNHRATSEQPALTAKYEETGKISLVGGTRVPDRAERWCMAKSFGAGLFDAAREPRQTDLRTGCQSVGQGDSGLRRRIVTGDAGDIDGLRKLSRPRWRGQARREY